MAIPRLSLNVAKLMELKERERTQKKSHDIDLLQRAIRQKSFDDKMLTLSLTPRPSKAKTLNDELNSNYYHLRLAKTMQTKNQYKQPLSASNTNTPKPASQSHPFSPTMQPSGSSTQQAYKAQMNKLLAQDLAVQKKLMKEKLAKKHAIEDKVADMERMSRMGM